MQGEATSRLDSSSSSASRKVLGDSCSGDIHSSNIGDSKSANARYKFASVLRHESSPLLFSFNNSFEFSATRLSEFRLGK